MSEYPIKRNNDEIKRSDQEDHQIIGPSYYSPFFSFRYSYKEISSLNEKTYIRSKECRFENGKFESEEFEGITDHNLYNDTVREMQNYFLNQTASFLNQMAYFLNLSMSSFLPFNIKDKDKK